MHVLTKILIVLVSLLAVLLVPLVVVYAYNENSYQARFEAAEVKAAVAAKDLASAQAAHGASEERLQQRIAELRQGTELLRRDQAAGEAEVRQLQVRLTSAETLKADINSKLATLASAVDAGQQLTESLITELRDLRSSSLSSERQKVELDEALREVTGQLEVAVAARRALQEELQRLTDEHARAMGTLSQFEARYGQMEQEFNAAVLPDRNIDTTILRVERGGDRVLAEINVGSRDGVVQGLEMIIADGGTYIGNLRIIRVDINRATGVIERESPSRGMAQIGQRVYTRRGQQ